MRRARVLILALLWVAAVAGLAWAAADAARSREVIGSGASEATAGDGSTSSDEVVLRGTLGEPVIGVVSGARGDVVVGQGYWHGGLGLYTVRLPLVVRGR